MVRSSATRFFTLPRDFTCRSTSSYPKSKTATRGDGRNCSLATTTASNPVALRNARRKRVLALRAPRKVCHLERITVQEKTENPKRMASTTITIAQKAGVCLGRTAESLPLGKNHRPGKNREPQEDGQHNDHHRAVRHQLQNIHL